MSEEATATPSKGYLHACQRAELLGQPKPTEAEWLVSEERELERDAAEQEIHDDAVAQELTENDESMTHISGGLDELNTILSATQKKINKFKNVCGSLGTLLKARVVSQSSCSSEQSQMSASEQQQQQESEANAGDATDSQEQVEVESDSESGDTQQLATSRKAELNSKLGSHIGKLDSLITKAENAQYSMKQQTAQMKQFFK